MTRTWVKVLGTSNAAGTERTVYCNLQDTQDAKVMNLNTNSYVHMKILVARFGMDSFACIGPQPNKNGGKKFLFVI